MKGLGWLGMAATTLPLFYTLGCMDCGAPPRYVPNRPNPNQPHQPPPHTDYFAPDDGGGAAGPAR